MLTTLLLIIFYAMFHKLSVNTPSLGSKFDF